MPDPDPPVGVDRVRAAALAALRADGAGVDAWERVCRACVALLPVDGASISVMSGPANREVLYASDEVAARIEALQFSLGEGPCFEAVESRRPVLVPDLAEASPRSWPVFAAEMINQPVGAIFAFPLQSGAACFGAMDLYRRRPGWLSPEDVATALQVVDVASLTLLGLHANGAARVDGEWLMNLPRDREQVHQATGMMIAALDISAEHALARLRGYAFAAGRLVDEVARDIVDRHLSPFDFDADREPPAMDVGR